MSTQPFFIVSSGRSGSKLMEKLLGGFPDVEMHHEYLCTHVQPLAARYYMGLIELDEVLDSLRQWHCAAVQYSRARLWGDSSNKLSWLVSELHMLLPNARFVYLVRDGRKVAGSFFHKLGDECYDDRSTALLQAHVDDPERFPTPPPEKKYWWPLPPSGHKLAKAFRGYDHFQRICFHWREINRVILKQFENIPSSRTFMVKLEDLVTKPERLEALLDFLELPYSDEAFDVVSRPHNVNVPVDTALSAKQADQLFEIAGDMMAFFGYDRKTSYRMVYNGGIPIVYDNQ